MNYSYHPFPSSSSSCVPGNVSDLCACADLLKKKAHCNVTTYRLQLLSVSFSARPNIISISYALQMTPLLPGGSPCPTTFGWKKPAAEKEGKLFAFQIRPDTKGKNPLWVHKLINISHNRKSDDQGLDWRGSAVCLTLFCLYNQMLWIQNMVMIFRNGFKGANRQQKTTVVGQSEILSLLRGLDLRGC